MLRIHEIKLNIGENKEELPQKLLKRLRHKGLKLESFQIVKESIDARDKENIKLIFTIDFSVAYADSNKDSSKLEEKLLQLKDVKLEAAPDLSYKYVPEGKLQMKNRPVVVGFGPCGMFAALILSEMGYKPLVIERGKSMEERVKDLALFWNEGIFNPDSNVQFGEGGAGTFSDGKLTTQIKDPRIRKVLEEFVNAGASEEILYKQKPHIGTDVLRKVVVNIRKKIMANGGEILFEKKLSSIKVKDNLEKQELQAITINDKDSVETENLILAIGHSARDTVKHLHGIGLNMEQKPFSIGVRIEHPQDIINEAQYGKNWQDYNLGAAEYKLSHHCENGRGVYTFCMCPGGYVVAAASEQGRLVTNGMSYSKRDSGNANSGLLVDVRREDFNGDSPLAGIEFQEKYESLAFKAGGSNYKAPAQRLGDFMGEVKEEDREDLNPTYRPGIMWTDLSRCLPDFAVESLKEAIPKLGKKLKGFDDKASILTGIETRSSSPVRILRDKDFMGNIKGLYPAGEGAGYAGGIVSAAVDGIKVAEEIVKKYSSNNL